jgi:hypothetical protein
MTFADKSHMGVKSPSFTPHTEKQLQSERNEDSAPQHLKAARAAQATGGEPIAVRIGRAAQLTSRALFAADALQDVVVALVVRCWGYAKIGRHLRLPRRLVWDLWLQHCAERRVLTFKPYRFEYRAVGS